VAAADRLIPLRDATSQCRREKHGAETDVAKIRGWFGTKKVAFDAGLVRVLEEPDLVLRLLSLLIRS
jgi:hypothetical protein